MPDIKDAWQLLLPRSPLSLEREGKFPKYAEVIVDLTFAESFRAFALGLAKRYCWLCRLTGLAWVAWIFNFVLISFLGLRCGWNLAHGGGATDGSIGPLDLRTVVYVCVVVLFCTFYGYSGIVLLCQQLNDSCKEDIKNLRERVKVSYVDRRAGE